MTMIEEAPLREPYHDKCAYATLSRQIFDLFVLIL